MRLLQMGLFCLVFCAGLRLAEAAEKSSGDGASRSVVSLNETDVNALRSRLLKNMPNLPIVGIDPSPVPGLYEVSLNTGENVLVDPSGDFFIFGGQVLKVNGPGVLVNLTEQKASMARVKLLESADEAKMLIYAPDGDVKGDLYVFTDVDCGYCQKFHDEVPELNKLGVRVKYLAWPRAGLNSATARKMTQVWCADDPHAAMDQAKGRQTIKSDKLCEAPIPAHFDLGLRLGVKGTPAIFLANGKQVGGYRSAKELAQELGIE